MRTGTATVFVLLLLVVTALLLADILRARAPRTRARSADRCAWGRIESAGEQHAVRRSVAIESGGLRQRHEIATGGTAAGGDQRHRARRAHCRRVRSPPAFA
jgi:hypothetical protein